MNAPIPILDLSAQHAALQADLEAAALRVLRSGRYVLGPEVEAFEAELGAELDGAHVVSCASGTDALCLALRALEIGPGDDVLVPAFTFAASAEAVALTGATPVFADIEPDSFLLDLAACQRAQTGRIKAVIAVHLFGRPLDIAALRTALGPGVAVIEDCAQSFGARCDGRATGGLGEVGCFSFFPSKNLGACGDGGAVATQDPGLAERLRMLRNHGSRQMYRHEALGLNSRLDELQAAILRVKLPHIDAWNRQRQDVARRYAERLQAFPSLKLPADAPGHVWHQYTVQSPQRDALQKQLGQDGIDSRVYYPIPLHRQSAYAHWAPDGALPAAEQACAECLSLPMYPELEDAQLDRIAASLTRAAA